MTDSLDIRQPELRAVRRAGTVRLYEDDKGYGRITADDGEVLFVHFSSIVAEGYRSLEPGQRVSFVWNGGIQDHGRHRAEDVRLGSSGVPMGKCGGPVVVVFEGRGEVRSPRGEPARTDEEELAHAE